ncbi:MAG: TRAP transporter substrate-binding protein DctP [Pseudomonadales bacterium]|nr:TRAP transporter substrate-binding protein DctP [Pseudomonadales bacterium]
MFRPKDSLLLVLCVLIALLAPSDAMAKRYKIATISPDGLGWMNKLRAGVDEIKEQTDGRVVFKIYPGGVQGDDYTVLRKMRIGQLQGGAVTASSLTRFYPDLQLYNLPLEFRNREEVDYVRERMDQRIISGLHDGGLVSFRLTETGFAYLLTKKPITNVEEMQGVKIWVPEGDPIAAKLIQSFGISPIPLPITDVLAGLQTGLIDAVAVPPIVALALQWHNQVAYVTNLPLMYIYSMMAIDKKAFQTMAKGDQAIVLEVMNGVFEAVDKDNRVDNVKAYDALLAQGIKEVQPDLSKLDSWRAQAQTSIDDLIADGKLSQQGLDLLRQNLKAVRDQHSDSDSDSDSDSE